MFKTVSLSLAALVASVGIASADASHLSPLVKNQTANGQVELGTVVAEADGVVELYSFHKGTQGALLGTTKVKAGANQQVNVNIARPSTNAIAVLRVNDEVVDTQKIEFN